MVRGDFHPVASSFGLTDGAAKGYSHLGKTCSQSDVTLATGIDPLAGCLPLRKGRVILILDLLSGCEDDAVTFASAYSINGGDCFYCYYYVFFLALLLPAPLM